MKKFKAIFFALLGLFLSLTEKVQADDYGLDASAPDAIKQNTNLPALAGDLIGKALALVGVLFFVLLIYGGLLWMTDMGGGKRKEKGKTLITDAVIGLVIVLSAYAITAFIGGQLTG